jgi:hypothetical protein
MFKGMKELKFTKNPYLLFAPFCIVFIVLVFFFHKESSEGDEGRFISYANNLCNGFFSPPAPNVDLGNGPGYPLIIMPIIALGLPMVYVILLNAFFYYFSIIFLYKTLELLVSYRLTLIGSFFWAFFYNIYEFMFVTVSEVFSFLLVTAVLFYTVKAFTPLAGKTPRKYLYLSGFAFAFLILTRPIFGYVLLVMLLGCCFLLLFKRNSVNLRNSVSILLIGFAFITPYLIYTYNLTGKFFYLSSSGGNNLYWMTTPYEGEYGSWCRDPTFKPDTLSESKYIPEARELIKNNHIQNFREIYMAKGSVAQDDVYKQIAVKNIKEHPLKFFSNCYSNIGRILFNSPFSYKLQNPSTLLRIPLTGIILVLMVFSALPTLVNWKRINFSVKFAFCFAFIYLGGSVFGSAETRMFTTVVPFLLFWVFYIIEKTIKVNMKFP